MEIDNEGKVRVLYQGFVGDGCMKEAERLASNLRALGLEVTTEEIKRTEENVTERREARYG
jgi:menaquinone-dependent protoporphyrinogen IX oxidase